jgi:hypothetical protein
MELEMRSMRIKLSHRKGSEFITWDQAVVHKGHKRVTFLHGREVVLSVLVSQIEDFEYLN